MDLSAAFNMVDHEVLTTILRNKFGVTDTALQWFYSYLQPRQFKVCVNKSYSSEISLKYSVPQGSCAGANVFNLYCSPLGEVVGLDLALSGFTDDHSIRTEFSANNREEELYCINKIQDTMITIKSWMDAMRLKLNPSKTEFIYFGHRLQLRKCMEDSINMTGDTIQRSHSIRYLGAILHSELNYKNHIATKCKAAMCNLLKIGSIRHLLDTKTTANLCMGLCISHLDYAKSLLYGLPKATMYRLQRIQNICTRLILKKELRDSITECLMELHWLPIEYGIWFKILTLTHKCIHGICPLYLRHLLTELQPNREGLRSQKLTYLLLIPHTRCKTFAVRAFSTATPELWNGLPNYLREIDNFLIFKSKLKMHLFRQAYQLN